MCLYTLAQVNPSSEVSNNSLTAVSPTTTDFAVTCRCRIDQLGYIFMWFGFISSAFHKHHKVLTSLSQSIREIYVISNHSGQFLKVTVLCLKSHAPVMY